MIATKTSGLLDALVKVKKDDILTGGAIGYGWHRKNAFENLKVKEGVLKRDTWMNEVRNIVSAKGVNWKTAMSIASNDRKTANPSYTTVKETVLSNYKSQTEVYRPNRHLNKHVLTERSANELLKEYYKSRGRQIGNLKLANKSMKTDIAKKRTVALEPCKTITKIDKTGKKHTLAVKTDACADSWLFRKPNKYDISKVDHGNKENLLYNVKL